MSRPLSWIDRIYTIFQAVTSSARSHYDRKDLERLFSLQPRSAQNLMSALPTVSVGKAHLVERAALLLFLSQLRQADDPGELYAKLKSAKGSKTKRKIQNFVLDDLVADLDTLPSTVSLSVGEVRVQFQNAEELVEAMMHLAIVLDKQLDAFVAKYQPPKSIDPELKAIRDSEEADLKYISSFTIDPLRKESKVGPGS